MKLLRSKFATALVVSGLMFGMLSFTTTPVSAQETFSDTEVLTEDELYARGLVRVAGKYFTRGLVAAFAFAGEFFGTNVVNEDLPTDALDQ